MISRENTLRLHLMIGLSALIAIALVMWGQNALFAIAKPFTSILVIILFCALVSTWTCISKLILIGLIFCLLGDLFLLNDAYFIYGLSAFFIAHACFLGAFVLHDGVKLHAISALCLFVVSGAYYSLLLPNLGPLMVAVGVYFAIILLMTMKGVSMAMHHAGRHYRVLAIAAILFMVSDSLIGFNKFITPFAWSPVAILSTYWLSIALLANAGARLSNAHQRNID